MFDFEKLIVYQKAKEFNHIVSNEVIMNISSDRTTTNQLHRAALSIVLNIAEGCSRYSKADRRNFFVISRGSAYECVAILDILKTDNKIDQELYLRCYNVAEEVSKMLFTLEKSLLNK